MNVESPKSQSLVDLSASAAFAETRVVEAARHEGRSLEAQAALASVKQRLFGIDVMPRPSMGRFELLRRLGSGAMGVVYEAYDPDLDRRVALKVLRPEVAARTRL